MNSVRSFLCLKCPWRIATACQRAIPIRKYTLLLIEPAIMSVDFILFSRLIHVQLGQIYET